MIRFKMVADVMCNSCYIKGSQIKDREYYYDSQHQCVKFKSKRILSFTKIQAKIEGLRGNFIYIIFI